MSRFISQGGAHNWRSHRPYRPTSLPPSHEPHPVARMIILAGLAASVLIWFV